MSCTDHLSELEALRLQVADLTRTLAEREQSMIAERLHLEEMQQDFREQSDLLRAIIEGAGTETGNDFFAALVTHLTRAFHVQYAAIGEVSESPSKKIRTLAVSGGGALVDNFEYELAHTPCATALTQGFACFNQDLQTTFPLFDRLADLGAESYCAVSIRAKGGAVIGLIVVMDTKPLPQGDRLRSILEIFAPRVAAELERRRAEQERAQALVDLRNVIETIPDIVFALDTQGNLVKWNQRLREVTGYSPEELWNKPALSFVPPEEQTRTAAAIQRAFTEGYAELEGLLLTKDSRTIPYHWTGAALKDLQGRIIGITGIGRDVSDRKQGEEELQRQRRHLVEAQALAHLGSWHWDIDSGQGQWSDEHFRIFGREPGSIKVTYETFLVALHQDDRAAVSAAINDALVGKRPYDVECRIVRPNSEVRFIHARGEVHRDTSGHPRSMAGTALDITERKRAEEALREREEALVRFKSTLDQTHDCVFMFAPDTLRFIYCNRGAVQQVGYSEAELFTMTPVDIKPEFTEQSFRKMLRALQEGQRGSHVFETVHRHKDGHDVPVEVSLQLVREQGQEGRFVAVVRDITDRKQAEEALRASEERFDLAVRGSNTGIWDWDLRTSKTYFSPQWKNMLGYGEDELTGEFFEWENRLHPDDRERSSAAVRAYLNGTTPQYELEHRLRHKDGSYRWILARGVSIRDAEGKPYRMAGSHIDITEQKQTQEALARRERQLQTVLDALPVGIWFTDQSGRPVFSNPAAKQIWTDIKQVGIETTDDNSGWWEAAGSSDAFHRWALGHVLMTGVPSLNETLELECLNGTKKTVRNSTVPVLDEAGDVLGAIVLNEDITLLRHAQEALRLTQFSVDHAVEGFIWVSPDARIVHVNNAACHILEYTRDELMAMTVHDLDPNFSPDVWLNHWEELNLKKSLTFESKYWSRTGRVLDIEVTANYLQCEGKEYNCAIIRDITERKQLAEREVSRVRQLKKLYEFSMTLSGDPGVVLEHAVRIIGELFNVQVVCLSEIVGEELYFKSVYVNGQTLMDAGHCSLAITPCATVEYTKDLRIFDRVMERFPQASFLRDHQAFSYCGFPALDNEGRVVAVTCLLDKKPHEFSKEEQDLLRIFGQRIAVEIERSRHVAERKRTDRALRASEERYRALYDETPTLYITLTTDGTVRSVNRFGAEQLGYQVEELTGTSVMSSIIHEHDRETLTTSLSKSLATLETTSHWEFRMVRKDRSLIWVRETARVGQSSAGETIVFMTCEDITDRKANEQILAAEKRVLEMTATDVSLQEVLTQICQTVEELSDGAYCSILLLDRDGLHLRHGAAPSLPEAYNLAIDGVAVGPAVGSCGTAAFMRRQVIVSDIARDPLWADFRDLALHHGLRACWSSPVMSSDGNVLGTFAVYYGEPQQPSPTDLWLIERAAHIACIAIERKQAEEELRNSHAFLRQVIDINPNFIFAKDRAGRFTLVNKAVADAYGARVEELIGKTDAQLNSNLNEGAFFGQMDLSVLDSLKDLVIPEEVITDSAGRIRWFQTVKRPILDGEGRAIMVLGAASDITDRKRMEEALRQREHDLRAALDERERISQDLHDGILQSLFAVGLMLETTQSIMSPRIRKSTSQALDQAIAQLNFVMREIRNFIAGLGSDLLQGKDLPTAVRHVLASLTENQAMRVRLAVEDRAAKALSAEQSLHLLRVIQEAVSNCIRHGRAQEARVSLKMVKQGVRLSIRDNGCGFDPDRVRETGHGLGNMAARAQRMGGRLTLSSKMNQGTRVVLDLPTEIDDVRR